jgi:5'-deoxynucleotidase YfbR-like HD superfamily hydrolase
VSNTWMQTISGKVVDFDDIRPEAFEIWDIAHALSRINRFLGHTHEPYTVAEHSVRVAELVLSWHPGNHELALRALLHDAAEAYVGDTTSPVKAFIRRQTYALDVLEARLERAILERFGLRHLRSEPPLALTEAEGIAEIIKKADLVVLSTEHRDHVPPGERDWRLAYPPHVEALPPPMSAELAEQVFLKLFCALFGDRISAALRAPRRTEVQR